LGVDRDDVPAFEHPAPSPHPRPDQPIEPVAVHGGERTPDRGLRWSAPARALLREAFTLPGDLQITGTTLHVRLDPASAPRRSRALAALAAELTNTATRYPGTNFTLAYSVKGQHDPS